MRTSRFAPVQDKDKETPWSRTGSHLHTTTQQQHSRKFRPKPNNQSKVFKNPRVVKIAPPCEDGPVGGDHLRADAACSLLYIYMDDIELPGCGQRLGTRGLRGLPQRPVARDISPHWGRTPTRISMGGRAFGCLVFSHRASSCRAFAGHPYGSKSRSRRNTRLSWR